MQIGAEGTASMDETPKGKLSFVSHFYMPSIQLQVKTSLISFPSSATIVSEPLGLVLVISAWNFPFVELLLWSICLITTLSLDPVVGAIAAGNAVVLKPSESAPDTSSLLAKLVEKYMDTSAVKVVEGAVALTTALLHQKWDKIFYTGGSEVGHIVLTCVATHLTPVVLELGGKCPAVLDSNINLKVAVRRIIAGKWGCNNGQACISPDYIITTKDFLLDDAQVSGKIVCGGERDILNIKIAPTLILDVSRDSVVMDEEIFDPILPILTVDKIEESFGVINGKEKPLAAYLFTNDKKLEEKFVRNISAGGIIINDTILHFLEPGLPL
ncbi:aldehyde dehydrogenase (NAD(+)) [Salvia divinorum]|uniref:Aldehyde dehydrogenase (NAD(+)) n=1 Tax=Salvia divinorum TaxID=28513 RepID=A0ABD1HQ60_SALDI